MLIVVFSFCSFLFYLAALQIVTLITGVTNGEALFGEYAGTLNGAEKIGFFHFG